MRGMEFPPKDFEEIWFVFFILSNIRKKKNETFFLSEQWKHIVFFFLPEFYYKRELVFPANQKKKSKIWAPAKAPLKKILIIKESPFLSIRIKICVSKRKK